MNVTVWWFRRLQRWIPEGITYSDMTFFVAGKRAKRVVFLFIFSAFFGESVISVNICQ